MTKKTEKVENWATKKTSDIYKKCEDTWPTIEKAYKNRREADDAIKEYWAIYNTEFDSNQRYQGNSQTYIPAVRDNINARAKRALKQLFPNRFKHVEAVGTDNVKPYPQLALQEHYIRKTKLKSICRSMLVAGDITGQWNIYIDWMNSTTYVKDLIKRQPKIDGLDLDDKTAEPIEEVKDEEVIDQGPVLTDFATEDLVVIPPTASSIETADIVVLKLRMTKDTVKDMRNKGVFNIPKDTDISDWLDEKKGADRKNPPKERVSDSGIKTEGTNKFLEVYEATMRIEFEDGKKSLGYIYYVGGEGEIVGIIQAPQWGQKRPIISAPVDRVGGSFFGISKVEPVKYLQWNLNDFWNQGQDSATYSLQPIVMTDPEKNPNYASMVLGLAAVWSTSPNDTQFASFPHLWKDAVEMCSAIKAQIQESMDVNPMMMGKVPNGRKNAGVVGAQQQEQSIPILDHAERFEQEILNPLMERIFEYDCQWREKEITVLTRGDIGVQSQLQVIEPQQWGERYTFVWVGTDFTMSMQMIQQQIATMNVLRGIPPQQLNGRKLDITPILESICDNVFGSELSGRILIDDRNKYSVNPQVEDEMMINGIMVDVHEADDDVEHLRAHQESAKLSGDPQGLMRTHMQAHMKQLTEKRQKAMGAQQPPQGAMGVPGGAGPGVAGTPRMGAQPAGPQNMQQPPGAIHPDQMGGRG